MLIDIECKQNNGNILKLPHVQYYKITLLIVIIFNIENCFLFVIENFVVLAKKFNVLSDKRNDQKCIMWKLVCKTKCYYIK